MQALEGLENTLADVYKNAPALDKKTKLSIVNVWPWVALIAGILQIYAAYALWHASHYVNRFADYTNSLSQALTGKSIDYPHLGFTFYLGLAILAASGVVILAAYPKLKAKAKTGWDLLFLGVLLNLVYGIVMLFVAGSNGPSRLIGSVIGAVVGFYFLFQIREVYLPAKDTPKA